MKKILILILLPLMGVMCCCSSDDKEDPLVPPSDVQLTVAPEALRFAFEAGSSEIVVTSNVEWGVSSDRNWCKSSLTGGIKGNTTLKVSVEKNSSGAPREATLTFKSGSYYKKYTVIQNNEVKVVTIPDAAFNTYCLANFDSDRDGVISENEALEAKEIHVPAKGIASMTGLEKFTEVTVLDCSGNILTELEVAALRKLKTLNCSGNKLSALNIQSNINLENFDCTDNPMLAQILVWTGFKPADTFKKPVTASYVEPEIPTPAGYTLVWQDEFNDARLSGGKPALPNTSEWWYETGASGWGNNEIQNYIAGTNGRDTCSVVTDGTLKIIARKVGSQVLSARMNTSKSWTYGYFEARLKLPVGKGTWPAFWMMPKNYTAWPADGEIDIMEEVGYRPNWVSTSIHCTTYNHSIGTQKTAEKFVATSQSEFHLYALEWTPDFIKGYIDGECFYTFLNDKKGNKDSWPFDAPFYVKLNLAWGGDWGGAEGVDETKLPATYEIDYVRVFQKSK